MYFSNGSIGLSPKLSHFVCEYSLINSLNLKSSFFQLNMQNSALNIHEQQI